MLFQERIDFILEYFRQLIRANYKTFKKAQIVSGRDISYKPFKSRRHGDNMIRLVF